jgi:hypothetical protein
MPIFKDHDAWLVWMVNLLPASVAGFQTPVEKSRWELFSVRLFHQPFFPTNIAIEPKNHFKALSSYPVSVHVIYSVRRYGHVYSIHIIYIMSMPKPEKNMHSSAVSSCMKIPLKRCRLPMGGPIGIN